MMQVHACIHLKVVDMHRTRMRIILVYFLTRSSSNKKAMCNGDNRIDMM
jgi:hypothetical protein